MGTPLSLLPGGLSGHRIGPNVILRVAEALREDEGESRMRELFTQAGVERYLDAPPAPMIDEREVVVLHRTLWAALGQEHAREIERRAGAACAHYILCRHVPPPLRWALRILPGRIAGPMLLAAIVHNSWTFAGSARVTAGFGSPLRLLIENNPMCRGTPADQPECIYYTATLERLFRVLIDRRARVTEVQCEARGDSVCCFEIRLH